MHASWSQPPEPSEFQPQQSWEGQGKDMRGKGKTEGRGARGKEKGAASGRGSAAMGRQKGKPQPVVQQQFRNWAATDCYQFGDGGQRYKAMALPDAEHYGWDMSMPDAMLAVSASGYTEDLGSAELFSAEASSSNRTDASDHGKVLFDFTDESDESSNLSSSRSNFSSDDGSNFSTDDSDDTVFDFPDDSDDGTRCSSSSSPSYDSDSSADTLFDDDSFEQSAGGKYLGCASVHDVSATGLYVPPNQYQDSQSSSPSSTLTNSNTLSNDGHGCSINDTVSRLPSLDEQMLPCDHARPNLVDVNRQLPQVKGPGVSFRPAAAAQTSAVSKADKNHNAKMCIFCTEDGGLSTRRQGLWLKRYGYRGPEYCERCSETFRTHIIRKRKNVVGCTREVPCKLLCSKMLPLFRCQGKELWAIFDKTGGDDRRSNAYCTADTVCPHCEKGIRGHVAEPVNDASGTQSKTRVRRQQRHTRQTQVMGRHLRSFGYAGPDYCMRCCEIFRDHLVRCAAVDSTFLSRAQLKLGLPCRCGSGATRQTAPVSVHAATVPRF